MMDKFKDQEALQKAYESLEKEFTRRSQQLKKLIEENKKLSIKVWNYEQPVQVPLYNSEGMIHCNLVTCYNENFDLKAKNTELQKQVNELKKELEKAYITERTNIQAEIADTGTSCHWCENITIKNTAKKILDELDLFFKGTTFRKGYEFKKIDQKLKEMAKNYNVEKNEDGRFDDGQED